MSRFWAIAGGVVAAAATLALPAGARMQAASGDVCTASGSGTQYTLHLVIPTGVQQYGFAVRATGGTVTNIGIPGANGNFSTAVASLAPNTTAGWFSDAPLPAESTATITTSGALKSLAIVPSFNASAVNGGSTPATGETQPNNGAPSFFDAVTCTLGAGVATQTATFTIGPKATYSAKLRAWQLPVKVSGPGIVSAVQLVPTAGGAYANSTTAKPLVQVRRVSTKSGGSVTLTLKPTSTGQAALEAKGMFKVTLRVTYNAESGASAKKNVTLTLRA